VVSAGFIVRSKDGKYLLGKTTKYPKEQCWTVFKGQQERNESLIATATRELREESGIDILRSVDLQLSQSTSPYFSFAMKDKDVILYLLNDEKGVLDNCNFKCSSYWGPNKTPEIEEFKWCTVDEMEKLVFPSQRGLVEHLRKSKL
jgi:8-oxo-dGTP pyrophosphatase MutT (NUDIX family)